MALIQIPQRVKGGNMSYPRYEVYKDASGDFRFRLKSAGNYETILSSSEGYKNKSDCYNAINICQRNSPYDSYYDRRTSLNSQYYFTLRSSNGRDIGISELYSSPASREQGITAVKRDGPTQTVVEL